MKFEQKMQNLNEHLINTRSPMRSPFMHRRSSYTEDKSGHFRFLDRRAPFHQSSGRWNIDR